MYRILQLSDIHVGGDYGGKFDCHGHLTAALNHYAKNQPKPDKVIVTGDVCDAGKTVNDYVDVMLAICDRVGVEKEQIVWLPGNHDDPDLMAAAYGSQFKWGPVDIGYLDSSREDARIPVAYIDTSSTNPDMLRIVDGLMEFFVTQMPNVPTVVFTHKPIGKAYHRFMNSLDDLPKAGYLASIMSKLHVEHIFCGHHHNAATIVNKGQPVIHVAPAIQVQIDPYSEGCNPSGNYPGYTVIGLSCVGGPGANQLVCESEIVFVEDWVKYTV